MSASEIRHRLQQMRSIISEVDSSMQIIIILYSRNHISSMQKIIEITNLGKDPIILIVYTGDLVRMVTILSPPQQDGSIIPGKRKLPMNIRK